MYNNYVYNAKPNTVKFIAWSSLPTQSVWLVLNANSVHNTALFSSTSHFKASCCSLKTFPISIINFESVLNMHKHFKSSDTHQDWHICTFQCMWSLIHCHIMTKLRLPVIWLAARYVVEDRTQTTHWAALGRGIRDPWCPKQQFLTVPSLAIFLAA